MREAAVRKVSIRTAGENILVHSGQWGAVSGRVEDGRVGRGWILELRPMRWH